MKKKPDLPVADDLLPEYDFRGAVRGKYADAFGVGNNVILLDEDVAAVFPDAAAVNQALRGLIDVSRRAVDKVGVKGQRRRRVG